MPEILLVFVFTLIMVNTINLFFFNDSKVSPKSKTPSVPAQDTRTGNPGDWVVHMQKPKKEIAVTGCNTEGDVVKEIILMGHQFNNIKNIIRL